MDTDEVAAALADHVAHDPANRRKLLTDVHHMRAVTADLVPDAATRNAMAAVINLNVSKAFLSEAPPNDKVRADIARRMVEQEGIRPDVAERCIDLLSSALHPPQMHDPLPAETGAPEPEKDSVSTDESRTGSPLDTEKEMELGQSVEPDVAAASVPSVGRKEGDLLVTVAAISSLIAAALVVLVDVLTGIAGSRLVLDGLLVAGLVSSAIAVLVQQD